MRYLLATGFLFRLPEYLFDPTKDHTLCRICGAVYQSSLDRTQLRPALAISLRKRWSYLHANKHTPQQHQALVESGLWCTPEAAIKLAGFGVINLVDLVMSDEVSDAYKEAHVIPVQDCESEVDLNAVL